MDPPIVLGKSPGDEVARWLVLIRGDPDVFASSAFTDFVRLLESKVSQLAELPGQSASISDK